jgi:2-polyprenyl-3-methyl-5-hydroxy-6-metoxy-1,4-benzoquinol methylase
MTGTVQPDYFSCERSDVANLVPLEAKAILEVGAGFGALGRILRQRRDVVIDAVEINPAAASHLATVYRHHWIGDIESLVLDGALDQYDCIIFSDVLEHLVDPWTTLRNLVRRLRPGGVVVSSIPNVRNIGLIYRLLLQGRWDYEESGLLDRTHLRFFTRASIFELMQSAGLEIEQWGANRDKYTGRRKIVARISKLVSSDMDVCQFLTVARKI